VGKLQIVELAISALASLDEVINGGRAVIGKWQVADMTKVAITVQQRSAPLLLSLATRHL
jgi:hypothetical protein